MKGLCFDIQSYAIHDGPGIRTTVFLKGCPLSCRWCHNPEGIAGQPQFMSRRSASGTIDETVGSVVDIHELIAIIEKDLLFYDESGGGVTFSGGEPLAQAPFLNLLLAACNQREIHATLDTSGAAPWAVLEPILPQLQLVLFDLKIMDATLHRRYTGMSNRTLLKNLKRTAAGPTPLRIRVPLVPGITDGDDNLTRIVRFAASLHALEGIDLLPFHRIGSAKYRRLGLTDPMAATAPPDSQRVASIKHKFESAGFTVSIGG